MEKISEAKGIVTCSYNSDKKFTQHDWSTFFCTESQSVVMREAVEAFLSFVRDNNVQKHIVNVSTCTDSFTEADQKWISDYLVPKEIEYGIKFLANIISIDIFTALATEEWQEKVDGALTVKNFSNYEDAVAWLDTK
jgi:hypothetical protein